MASIMLTTQPPCPGHLMTFHRPDFQNALLRRLPPSYRIHCSKRLRSYTQRQGGPINLLFEDGTKASCDVLVGADGLKSAVRRSLLGEKAQWAQSENNWSEAADIAALIEPAWSGTNAYRAVIPADRLRARDPHHRVFRQPTQVRISTS
jgi:salicylate hydroxylase